VLLVVGLLVPHCCCCCQVLQQLLLACMLAKHNPHSCLSINTL
jgi:hypothetical protein